MKKSLCRRSVSLLSPASFVAAFALLSPILPAQAHAAKPPRSAPTPAVTAKPAVDPALFKSLAWREVGPYRGGRVGRRHRPAGQPRYLLLRQHRRRRLEDHGRRPDVANVSDGFFGGSIGAVAVAEWDPNVVYVGGGEKTVRGNVSHGDGMWKSTDAGKTWKHVGLADSRHIPRVRIHPKDPDLVYAAVLGHLFGPNEMRGVYRSQRRRRPLGARALRERQGGRRRPRHRPDEPAHPLRHAVERPAHALQPGERRPRLRTLEDHRRRRHLERADPQPRAAQRPARHHRRHRLARQLRERLRHRRGRGGRRLPLPRRRQDLGQDQRRPQPAPARLVLHPHLRRSEGRGRRLRPQRPVLPLEGRRQDVHQHPHAARRQPRPVDRPRRSRCG